MALLMSIKSLITLVGILAVGGVVAGIFVPITSNPLVNIILWCFFELALLGGFLWISYQGRRQQNIKEGHEAPWWDLINDASFDGILVFGGIYMVILFGFCLHHSVAKGKGRDDVILFGALTAFAVFAFASGLWRFGRALRHLRDR